jgi:large subunit ribosomal protein L22
MATASAKLNYLRMAPRKVRLVIDVIRGMSAFEAEAQLMMMKKRAAPAVLKLLRSAVSSAKAQNMAGAKLKVSTIRVDQGPTLKRSLPRAKGMATPIHKKSSHITIVLSEAEKEYKPRFRVARREKKDISGKGETKRKVAGAKGRVIAKDKKSAEDPGFIRRVFRRKTGE